MKLVGAGVVMLSSMAVGAAVGAVMAMNSPVVKRLYKKGLQKAKSLKLI